MNNNNNQRVYLQSDILIDTFGFFKRGSIDTTIVNTLDSCRLVCSRWDGIIKEHANQLHRIRMHGLYIFINKDDESVQYSSSMINWPHHRRCPCYTHVETEKRSLLLVDQLIFPNLSPTTVIQFSACDGSPSNASASASVIFHLLNQLTLQTAHDLVHFTRHLRNTFTTEMKIDAKGQSVDDLSINRLVCRALYPLNTNLFIPSVEMPANEQAMGLYALRQLRPALRKGFINTREVVCLMALTNDTGPMMEELLHFISQECPSNWRINKLRVRIGWRLQEESEHTIIDTIIRYFTTTPTSITSHWPVVEIKFPRHAYWPNSMLDKPNNYNPSREYSFQLQLMRSSEKKETFRVELFPRPSLYHVGQLGKMRLKLLNGKKGR